MAMFSLRSFVKKSPFLGNVISSFNSLRVSSYFEKRNEVEKIVSRTEIGHSKSISEKVFCNVNNFLSSRDYGRLFAIVQLCGKQYKVTSGDILLVEGYWPPTIGEQIRLEKVLLVGSNDFTLVGRPILESELVDVEATIIEKTLTHTKTHFKKKRRKQYTRINFQRSPNTMIRINSIKISGKVNESNKNVDFIKLF